MVNKHNIAYICTLVSVIMRRTHNFDFIVRLKNEKTFRGKYLLKFEQYLKSLTTQYLCYALYILWISVIFLIKGGSLYSIFRDVQMLDNGRLCKKAIIVNTRFDKQFKQVARGDLSKERINNHVPPTSKVKNMI